VSVQYAGLSISAGHQSNKRNASSTVQGPVSPVEPSSVGFEAYRGALSNADVSEEHRSILLGLLDLPELLLVDRFSNGLNGSLELDTSG
jgi:hypothetical protein